MKVTFSKNNDYNESQLSLQEKPGVPRTPAPTRSEISLALHPIPSQDALLVKIDPPRAPDTSDHVPNDIVLVIDVSGSMSSPAPVPGNDASESTGLCVLDLVKHAALTIVETLNAQDRLGIVTFSSEATVVQHLTPMTAQNKKTTIKNTNAMQTQDATNLWHGISLGLSLFKTPGRAVPAIMVLTDGMPNYLCPGTGYVPKLRTLMPLPASIHTFGFGYSLRSGLLKSIAEVGNGNYSFIPDAGMIGTVFVHAVANLQTTFATDAVLQLTYTSPLEIEETTGESVDQTAAKKIDQKSGTMRLEISLGNLQYGHPRDVFLRLKNAPSLKELEAMGYSDDGDALVTASLIMKRTDVSSTTHHVLGWTTSETTRSVSTLSVQRSILDATDLTPAEIAYNDSRARICAFLSSLFPLDGFFEHKSKSENVPSLYQIDMPFKPVVTSANLSEYQVQFKKLIESLPSKGHSDPLNQSLVEDLVGVEPKGQISLALNRDEYFYKWGIHYLPSLLNAHTRQICNSFKDSGPLQYGVDSPLFIKCRDKLNEAFDNLPPPKPTISQRYRTGASRGVSPRRFAFSMSRYNNSCGTCFGGSTPVELASGRTVAIRRLRRGTKVRTLAGPRKVAMVLKTPVNGESMCRVAGDLLVTPWHPISLDGKTWIFPANTAEGAVRYSGAIYSVLLQRDDDSNAHAFRVGGVWGVSLGHGVVSGDDVRAHEFLGDYDAVGKSLVRLGGGRKGVVIGGGVERDGETNLVSGFRKPERGAHKRSNLHV